MKTKINKFKYLLICGATSLILTACGGNSSSSMNTPASLGSSVESNYVSGDSASYDDYSLSDENISSANIKLIRTVDITMEVPTDKDLPKIINDIQNLAKENNAITTELNTSYDRYYSHGYLSLKVPKDKADIFINKLKETGNTVKNINDRSEDVTEKYVDTESRLKVKKETRDKYLEYLKNAKNVEETLQIEDRLNAVIADIESYQATLDTLKNQVEYTDITISIDCKTSTQKESFGTKLKDSLNRIAENAGSTFLNGFEWFVSAIIVLIFVLPILFILIKFFKFAIKGSKKLLNKKEKPINQVKNNEQKNG